MEVDAEAGSEGGGGEEREVEGGDRGVEYSQWVRDEICWEGDEDMRDAAMKSQSQA